MVTRVRHQRPREMKTLSEKTNSIYKVLRVCLVELRRGEKEITKINWRKVIKRTVCRGEERSKARNSFGIEIDFYWGDPYNINDQFIHEKDWEPRDRRRGEKIFTETSSKTPEGSIKYHLAVRNLWSDPLPSKVDTLNNNKVFYVGRETFLFPEASEREQQNYFIINPQGSLDNSTQLRLFAREAL